MQEQDKALQTMLFECERRHIDDEQKLREMQQQLQEQKKSLPDHQHEEITLLQKMLDAISSAFASLLDGLSRVQLQWRESYLASAQHTLKNAINSGLKTPDGKMLVVTPEKEKQLLNALVPTPFSLVLKMVPSFKQKIDDETAGQVLKANDLFAELKFHALLGGDENAPLLMGADLLKAIRANKKSYQSAIVPMHEDIAARKSMIHQEINFTTKLDQMRSAMGQVENQLEKMEFTINELSDTRPSHSMSMI